MPVNVPRHPYPPLRLRPLAAALLFSIAALPACAPVRLISAYDPATDAAVTALHRELEGLLLALERTAGTPDGEHERFEGAYRQIWVDVRSLQLRAAARERNQLQVEQLEALAENLERLEAAHAEGLRAEEVALFRRGFDQQLQAILRLELAKRNGDEP